MLLPSLSLFLTFIEWQRDDLRCGAFSTYIDLDGISDGMLGIDVAHADIFVESWAWCAAGECADLLLVVIDGIAITGDATFDHLDAYQLALGALFFDLEQCIAPNKISFIKFYRPAESGLERIGLFIEFVAVETVTGL